MLPSEDCLTGICICFCVLLSCIYHLLCVLFHYMLRVLMMKTVALGRIRWSHGLSYDRSMLEYKVIKFPPWLFSTMSNTTVGIKDTRAWQSPMETVTLIMPLEATTVNNPSNSRSDIWVTSGATVEQQQDRWYSKMEPKTQLRSINARIQG